MKFPKQKIKKKVFVSFNMTFFVCLLICYNLFTFSVKIKIEMHFSKHKQQ